MWVTAPPWRPTRWPAPALRAGVAAFLLGLSTLQGANLLTWQPTLNRVDADIQGMDLREVLAQIAEATGWQIFLEPGLEIKVTTKFSDRPPNKALDFLLGSLNRVLLPSSDGPPRLLVFKSDQNQATERIARKKSKSRESRIIKDELILKVKPGTDIEELAKMLGAKVVGRVGDLNLYRLKFDSEEAAQSARQLLEGREEVVSIENNFLVTNDEPAPLLQGSAESAPLNLKVKDVQTSDRIVVGLLDTALNPDQPGVKDFLIGSSTVSGESTHSGTEPLHADNMFQGILKGNAALPGDSEGTALGIYHVNIFGNNEASSTFDIMLGILDAVAHGASIINLSLSSYDSSPYLHEAILANSEGRIFIASAGNDGLVEGGTIPNLPASWPEVTSVTAGDRYGNIAVWANRSDTVDAVGPAYALVTYNGQTYVVGGTSISTAFASGLSATLKQQNPNLDDQQIQQLLQKMLPVHEVPGP